MDRHRPFTLKSEGDGRDVLWAEGLLRLDEFLFERGLRTKCELRVRLAEGLRGRPVDVIVRQLFEQTEVGRVTWRIVPGG